MATKERSAEPDPSLAAAVFCEMVLAERDGTYSFIRIVDSIGLYAPEGADLGAEQVLTHPLSLAIVLRSRSAVGVRKVTVRHTPPEGGSVLGGLPEDAEIEVSTDRLTVASVRLTGGALAAGRHEFEVRLGGRSLAVASLEVQYHHQPG